MPAPASEEGKLKTTEETGLVVYREDVEVRKAAAAAKTLLDEANELVVNDAATEAQANGLFGRCRDAKKGLKALQDRWVKPLKEHVKLIERDFKAMAVPAEEADEVVTGKLRGYRALQEAEGQKENERQRKLAERRQAAAVTRAEEKGAPPPPPIPMPTVAVPAKSVATEDGGRVTYRRTTHAEVVDAAAVPREWCAPDLVRLRAAAKDGVITPESHPAGVRVWVTEEPQYYGGGR
jgi:hypothetical protein